MNKIYGIGLSGLYIFLVCLFLWAPLVCSAWFLQFVPKCAKYLVIRSSTVTIVAFKEPGEDGNLKKKTCDASSDTGWTAGRLPNHCDRHLARGQVPSFQQCSDSGESIFCTWWKEQMDSIPKEKERWSKNKKGGTKAGEVVQVLPIRINIGKAHFSSHI